MKIILTTLLILTTVFTLAGANASAKEDIQLSGLPGHIEFLWTARPTSVKRVTPHSMRVEEVFRSSSSGENWVTGFDTLPDGKVRVLSVMTSALHRPSRLGLLEDSTFSTLVTGEAGVGLLPSLSPKGNQIGYLQYTDIRPPGHMFPACHLYVIGIDGRGNKQASTLLLDRLYKPSWFPDGKNIAASSTDWRIYIVDLETGRGKEIINFGKAPTVSHDGKRIAYLSREADEEARKALRDRKYYEEVYSKKLSYWQRLSFHDGRLAIYIYEVDTGESIRITDNLYIERPTVWSPDDRYLAYTERFYKTTRNIYILDPRARKTQKIPDLKGEVMAWTN